jgi:DNA-directed RNA polymerase sigma subunit (sigma70/sigma32)
VPNFAHLLGVLTPREEQIVRWHLGLQGEAPWSFAKIGLHFAIQRSRVHAIYRRALGKLNDPEFMHERLKDYPYGTR